MVSVSLSYLTSQLGKALDSELHAIGLMNTSEIENIENHLYSRPCVLSRLIFILSICGLVSLGGGAVGLVSFALGLMLYTWSGQTRGMAAILTVVVGGCVGFYMICVVLTCLGVLMIVVVLVVQRRSVNENQGNIPV
jgi:hypothetical protein